MEILLLVRIGVYHRNQMLPVPGYFFGDMTVWKVQNKASFWQTKSDNSLSVLKIVLTLAIASEERWVLLLSYSVRRYSIDYSSCCKLEYPINSCHSPRFKTKLLKRIQFWNSKFNKCMMLGTQKTSLFIPLNYESTQENQQLYIIP